MCWHECRRQATLADSSGGFFVVPEARFNLSDEELVERWAENVVVPALSAPG